MNTPYPTMSQRLDRIPLVGSLLGDSLAFWAGLADAANLTGLQYVLGADPSRKVVAETPTTVDWPVEDEARAA